MSEVIDVHTHILPRHIPRWAEQLPGARGFMTLEHVPNTCRAKMVTDDGRFFRDIEDTLWDPARRLGDCDVAGVTRQVLSTVPVMFSYWSKPEHGAVVSRFLNEDLAATVQRHPDRFYG